LPEIRQDQTVHKAARAKEFLFSYDSSSKAAADYNETFEALLETLGETRDVPAAQAV
jgi:hypothetical protein